ncbi:beta-ketoacyl-[acyl-carrier-protein] synthase family protein [Novipirellula artificiosorum]|uniref:3-oxoacyl-[acyl-carrier-protein] synthase 2 n=1 Tax=Novipirellula artificiosorum TaxID=2528016 RepID=A0A5C6DAE7_9BACT|nr:beta-ketoacyl synthase N-terminal-like domain-containing protein [Novipirellula artificiosorum]TWU32804.1 3-oxoacyl-[acyl-carrier-protein] synthase 2 [Novipirellula artificiosorum]
MPEKRIVITGAGVVSPIGIGHADFFDAVLRGDSGIRSLEDRDDDGPTPPDESNDPGIWIGAPVIGFDAKRFVKPRKAIKVMCREIQLSFAASMMAVDDAGLSGDLPASSDGPIRPDQIGTVFGSEMLFGPPTELVDAFIDCISENGSVIESQFGAAAMRKVMPLWMLKYLPNMPACHVGIALNAHGPNNTLVLGDTSAPAAMMEAISCIQRGTATWVMSGGCGTRINTTRMNYRNDLPTADVSDPISASSRPYDQASAGVVGGEAAVSFVLESMETARCRGANPLAEVVAMASRFVASGGMSLAKRSNLNHPSGIRGSAQAIELAVGEAIRKANLATADIGFVVSHAMGDPLMDEQERRALERCLPGVPLVTPIGLVGHCGAASGSIEVLVAVVALSRKVVPPSIVLPEAGAATVERRDAQPLTHDHVLCISHTSEGNAIATVLGRAALPS